MTEKDKEVVMYLIVRNDLGMSPGKVAAQVGHGVELAIATGKRFYQHYQVSDPPTTKIVLQANLSEFNNIINDCWPNYQVYDVVVDEGRTEIEPGSKTVLAFAAMPRYVLGPMLAHLKTYK